MRNTYHQSVGHPLQTDRLPATRPDMEMPPVPPEPALVLSLQARTLLRAIGLSAAVVLIYPPGPILLLDVLSIMAGLPLVLLSIHISRSQRAVDSLTFKPLAIGLVLLSMNYRLGAVLSPLLISLYLAVFVRRFVVHWAHHCTTVPVRRSEAESLRRVHRAQATVLAAALAVLTFLLFTTQSPLIVIALVTLPIAASVLPRLPLSSHLRLPAIRPSLTAWFSPDPPDFPGLLKLPVCLLKARTRLIILLAIFMSLSLVRCTHLQAPFSFRWLSQRTLHASTDRLPSLLRPRPSDSRPDTSVARSVFLLLFAPLIPCILAVSIAQPLLYELAVARARAAETHSLQDLYADIRRSTDPTERQSIYLGRVVADGTPVLIPRKVFQEHAHALGDSGSGKTSLFLCPLIEQLVLSGDCSVIVIDLKADTLELCATLQAAADRLFEEKGVRLPIKFFSNQPNRTTFAFNPLTQPFWSRFDLLTRTDILCAANGLTYGNDYGQGYYSAANAAILHHTMKTFPHVTTFTELADRIGQVVTSARKRDLHPEIRKAGVHVHEVIKRLASCDPLSVTDSTGHPPEVVENVIDLADIFLRPQLHYFHLSATLTPSGAPEIARLLTYMLLAASTQTERRHPVFLVIDEFQRMVASNLEYMLQLARSMGVGIILANQSLEDLKGATTDLIPPIEANCRLRQWFSVSSSDDQRRLVHASGLTVEELRTYSTSESPGGLTQSEAGREEAVTRFTINDILLTSDHPFRSFLRLARGAGYAQYGGLPVIIESAYHITHQEYQHRRSLPWPTATGAYCPAERSATPEAPRPEGPLLSEEVIGDSLPPDDTTKSIDELFSKFQKAKPSARRRGEGPKS